MMLFLIIYYLEQGWATFIYFFIFWRATLTNQM